MNKVVSIGKIFQCWGSVTEKNLFFENAVANILNLQTIYISCYSTRTDLK